MSLLFGKSKEKRNPGQDSEVKPAKRLGYLCGAIIFGWATFLILLPENPSGSRLQYPDSKNRKVNFNCAKHFFLAMLGRRIFRCVYTLFGPHIQKGGDGTFHGDLYRSTWLVAGRGGIYGGGGVKQRSRQTWLERGNEFFEMLYKKHEEPTQYNPKGSPSFLAFRAFSCHKQ